MQPIRLGRSYVSQKGLGYWDFLSYHVIFTADNFLEITEPSGATLLYEGTSAENQVVYALKNSDWKGITNTARGSLSGKHNLKNQRLEFTKKKYGFLITVVCSDGTKRIYESSLRFGQPAFFDKKSKFFSKYYGPIGQYFLIKEEFPNGNKILYEWPTGEPGDSWMIKSCNQDETIIYAWAKFYPKKAKYSQKDRSHGDYGIETSDGRHLEHYYFSHNKIHQLKKVESSEMPPETMEYLSCEDDRKILKMISWPHGRYREVKPPLD